VKFLQGSKYADNSLGVAALTVVNRKELYLQLCSRYVKRQQPPDRESSVDSTEERHLSLAGQLDRGTHWSLLVIDLISNHAYHFDSVRNNGTAFNDTPARNFVDHTKTFTSRPVIRFDDMDSYPLQSGSIECGIRVLRARDIMLRKIFNGRRDGPPLSQTITARDMGDMRACRQGLGDQLRELNALYRAETSSR